MQCSVQSPQRVNILGVPVSAIDTADAVAFIEAWIADGMSNYVCITGVHGVMESQRDPDLLRIHREAGLVTPDGMPLVWMSHRLGFPHVRRVYGPDLMRTMSARSAERGYRNFYYGGGPGIASKLEACLERKYSGLKVVGTLTPPFRPLSPDEDLAVVQQINAADPDIVWVGLSTPKQERWMAEHVGKLTAPVIIGVGAAFDFLSGEKPQAPAWMQRGGLEWLFRACSEPRRLAGRYARNNPAFIWQSVRQFVSPHRFPQV